MQPRTQFVAQFIGSTNQIGGRLRKMEGEGRATVDTDIGELLCGVTSEVTVGSQVAVVIRPEDLVLHSRRPASTENVVEGKVATVMFLGEYLDCTVEIGRKVLQTHQPRSLEVRRGEAVWVELPVGQCLALPGGEPGAG
jgi:ABC-type Fe3+/spermidine/putrescine transport system ATPase subunit